MIGNGLYHKNFPHRAKLKAILVDVVPKEVSRVDAEREIQETVRLVETYGGIVVVKVIQRRGRPSASTFLGSGKAEEVRDLAKTLGVDVVIFNNILKPNQVRNLHELFACNVWDRIDVILKIFEKHAKTREAKLQIELAELRHAFPKLYGRGTELSQQAGHRGIRSGAGEKMLEFHKRHLRRRIKDVEEKLEQVKHIREGQRMMRRRKNLPLVAIVGYTNSGKSTLLKALTGKNVYIADELFATLDTRLGDMYLKNSNRQILMADTIGFIQNLPPFLIESFLATLEEVKQADLLIHVIDASDPEHEKKMAVVAKVLLDLGCHQKPTIKAFNKIDLVTEQDNRFPPDSIAISAEKKLGLDRLKQTIEYHFAFTQQGFASR